MFTERQMQILRAVLCYGIANCDDINEAFTCEGSEKDPDNEAGMIDVNGEIIESFTDDEMDRLLMVMQ